MNAVPPLQSMLTVAAACALALLVSCQRESDEASWWLGEQQRIAASHELELAALRYQKASPDSYPELERLVSITAQQSEALVRLKQRRASLDAELEALESQQKGLHRSILQERRQKLLGMKFEKYQLNSGRTFDDVTIVSIQDSGVSIHHANGAARLRFADLNSTQREFFGLEEELAAMAQQQEAREAVAYDRWVNQQMAVAKRADPPTDSVERRVRNHRPIQMTSASVRPLAQPATRFGSGSSGYRRYSYDRPYRSTYHYVYYPRSVCRSTYRPLISMQSGRVVGGGCMTPSPTPSTSFADTTFTSIP